MTDNTKTRVSLLAATCLILTLAACGGSGANATKVAQEASAESCADSGYRIVFRTDGSEHTIWDCQIGGKTVCVAEEHGVASNITDLARLAFADTLNGRPSCLS